MKTVQTHGATDSVRAGGDGQFEPRGRAISFDATVGRLDARLVPPILLCTALSARLLE